MNQPSPRPWRLNDYKVYDAEGNVLFEFPHECADKQDRVNAELIFRAVNSHEKLLKWAKELVVRFNDCAEDDRCTDAAWLYTQIRKLEADIKEAEGEL